MKSLKYLVVASMMLSTVAMSAQLKNQKTESVKIYGNCGMCESNIEKAGNAKKEAIVDWDKDTKIASIKYDSSKTSKDEILKRIALAGYDSDLFLAPTAAYEALHGCCQYERVNKTADMEKPKMNHNSDAHSNHGESTQKSHELSEVFDSYFMMKDAMVQTNTTETSAAASALVTAIEQVKMGKLSSNTHDIWMKVMSDLKTSASKIAASKSIVDQRSHLNAMSKSMYDLMKTAENATPIYYQHCPMANDGKGANWLSKEEAVKNPYYGSKMMSCGKVVETLK